MDTDNSIDGDNPINGDNLNIDLNNITKSFRTIENSIAKYIYKKYIMPKSVQNVADAENAIAAEQDDAEAEDETEAENIANEDKNGILDNQLKNNQLKDNKKINNTINTSINTSINTKLYKLYLQKVFNLERHSFRILQEDVLKEDLKQMTIADKAYELNPTNFNPKEYDCLPDVLRCTYIRKHKHRYYRCQHKTINDDHDICKKHENSENIYIDKYNELLEKYQQQT